MQKMIEGGYWKSTRPLSILYGVFSALCAKRASKAESAIFTLAFIFHWERAGDNHALDLVCPLEDLEDLRVAQQFFNGIIPHIAVTAEDLNCIGCNAHHHIGGKALCLRAYLGGDGRLPVGEVRGIDVSCRAASISVSMSASIKLDGLIGIDGFPKGFSFLRVPERVFKGSLRDANGAGCGEDAPRSSVAIASLNPCPSLPTRLSAGIRTSSNSTSQVFDRRMPILSSSFPTLIPVVFASTRNMVSPFTPRLLSTDAIREKQSAYGRLL